MIGLLCVSLLAGNVAGGLLAQAEQTQVEEETEVVAVDDDLTVSEIQTEGVQTTRTAYTTKAINNSKDETEGGFELNLTFIAIVLVISLIVMLFLIAFESFL